MSRGKIVIAGAFDTKAEPFGHLVNALELLGEPSITIDTGVFGGEFGCTYPAQAVAEAAGHKLEDLPALGRAAAVNRMADGAAEILKELVSEGDVAALICMGGSNAAVVFSELVPVLPIGLPKILLATVVAGQTRALIAASDVILLYPIVDIEGDNSILRGMITRLAHVAIGAVQAGGLQEPRDAERSAALSMFGVTTKCVSTCRELLALENFESFVFHGNGSGGKSLESFVEQGLVSMVLDVTISELTDELFGGLWGVGPERVATAATCGVPQVIAPGALDMINFGPRSSLPEAFQHRLLHSHNALTTLVRTTPEENHQLGEVVAERLAEPKGPTSILVPTRGFSGLDAEGQPFYDPEATQAFVQGLRSNLSAAVPLTELDLHINDPEFAEALVKEAMQNWRKKEN
jgi:uncharacterized protein (UPF0261 family)